MKAGPRALPAICRMASSIERCFNFLRSCPCAPEHPHHCLPPRNELIHFQKAPHHPLPAAGTPAVPAAVTGVQSPQGTAPAHPGVPAPGWQQGPAVSPLHGWPGPSAHAAYRSSWLLSNFLLWFASPRFIHFLVICR